MPTSQYILLQQIGGNRTSDRALLASSTSNPDGSYEFLIGKKIVNKDVRGETERGQGGRNYVVVTSCEDVNDTEGEWVAHRVTCEVRHLGRAIPPGEKSWKAMTIKFETED